MAEEMKVSASLYRSVLERLEAAERARDTQSGVVAKLIIRERQLEEECSWLRAALRGLDDTMTKADNLLLRAEVQEADKAYEYELGERRAAEARIDAALEAIGPAYATYHDRAMLTEMLDAAVKVLKGEGE